MFLVDTDEISVFCISQYISWRRDSPRYSITYRLYLANKAFAVKNSLCDLKTSAVFLWTTLVIRNALHSETACCPLSLRPNHSSLKRDDRVRLTVGLFLGVVCLRDVVLCAGSVRGIKAFYVRPSSLPNRWATSYTNSRPWHYITNAPRCRSMQVTSILSHQHTKDQDNA